MSRYRCRCPRWCTSKATAGTSTCTCRGRDHLVTHTTLAQLEELLAEQGFLRLHKSYLVNMAFLDTLHNVERVEVLPYHTMGLFKWEKLGIPYPLPGITPPAKERVANAEEILGCK